MHILVESFLFQIKIWAGEQSQFSLGRHVFSKFLNQSSQVWILFASEAWVWATFSHESFFFSNQVHVKRVKKWLSNQFDYSSLDNSYFYTAPFYLT